ncbi:hypothetical protein RA19_16500 [Leisingera sp. ANG-M1]|uniref:mandelate racemase/muconate lactonizing enzyme family protein n=1 Tax=Leisingera sp. ANG-M1 TaxID=1577895 RepID=UPI00057E6907|nr:mandelate racemase/muconate lactonizing enzyme family protein [Leisingera sp. ANG-M1]KIC09299.1 hypothetical protein RA19_16500 [Leisingera sp. ANG-M1]
MKITSISPYILPGMPSPDGWAEIKPFLFVRLETDAGITGWGEVYALDNRIGALAVQVMEFAHLLTGRDAADIRGLRRFALREFSENRADLSLLCAFSGIEIALWDALGQHLNAPVCTLLGGSPAHPLPLYANFWSAYAPAGADVVRRAQALTGKGYKAVKIYPMQQGSVAAGAELVREVRAALGPDVKIMVDLSGQPDPQAALDLAELIRDYNIAWFEEPVDSSDLRLLAELTGKIPLPVVSGERLAGKTAFADLLQHRAANILNPDIAACGGILEFTEIAAMAAALSVEVTPHNYNSSGIAMAAMLHAAACSSNCRISEHFPHFDAATDGLIDTGIMIVESAAQLPARPGLGVNVNLTALEQRALTAVQWIERQLGGAS